MEQLLLANHFDLTDLPIQSTCSENRNEISLQIFDAYFEWATCRRFQDIQLTFLPYQILHDIFMQLIVRRYSRFFLKFPF
jgi:hypothetical protein